MRRRRTRCRSFRQAEGHGDGHGDDNDRRAHGSEHEPRAAGTLPGGPRIRPARSARRARARPLRPAGRARAAPLRPAGRARAAPLRPAGRASARPVRSGRRACARPLLPGVARPGRLLPGVARPGRLLPGVERPGRLLPGVERPGRLLPGVHVRLVGKEPQRPLQLFGELAAGQITISRVLGKRRGQHLVGGRGQVGAPRARRGRRRVQLRLGKRRGQHLVGGRGQVGAPRARRGRRRVQLRVHNGQALILPEWRRAAQQLEPGAGQRVEVRAPVNGSAFDLLGCDVIERSRELGHCGVLTRR